MACGLSALDELYGDETMLEDAMKTFLRLSNNNSTINKLQRAPPPPEPPGPLASFLAPRGLQTRGIEPRRRRLDGFVTPPHGPRPPLEPRLEPFFT